MEREHGCKILALHITHSDLILGTAYDPFPPPKEILSKELGVSTEDSGVVQPFPALPPQRSQERR